MGYVAGREAPDGFSALQRAEIAEIAADDPHLCFNATVSVLFNEPKLLKSAERYQTAYFERGFSALQRAEIAEIAAALLDLDADDAVSVLFNEPKLLKLSDPSLARLLTSTVSVLFNEPKLLKCGEAAAPAVPRSGFQCSSTSRNC